MRPPIFNQRLPKYDQRQKNRQHQRCEHHLNDREAGRVFAKEPTCNKAASTQEPVGGPSEPIKHISLRRPLSSTRNTRDSPPAPRDGVRANDVSTASANDRLRNSAKAAGALLVALFRHSGNRTPPSSFFKAIHFRDGVATCSPKNRTMAAKNKCLAARNKSGAMGAPTKRRRTPGART